MKNEQCPDMWRGEYILEISIWRFKCGRSGDRRLPKFRTTHTHTLTLMVST